MVGFFVALSRSYLLGWRSIGETLLEDIDGNLEIVSPLGQRSNSNAKFGTPKISGRTVEAPIASCRPIMPRKNTGQDGQFA
jgi:hypothetical protein